MTDNIEFRVKEVLAAILGRDMGGIEPTEKLRDQLGLGPLSTIELIYDIEAAFDLQIPDEDLGEIVTVRDLIDYVERVDV